MAEMMVKAYVKSYGLPCITTRSNNVYGPHQFPEKVVPQEVWQRATLTPSESQWVTGPVFMMKYGAQMKRPMERTSDRVDPSGWCAPAAPPRPARPPAGGLAAATLTQSQWVTGPVFRISQWS